MMITTRPFHLRQPQSVDKAKFSPKTQRDKLLSVADRFSPRLRTRIVRAFDRVKGRVRIQELTRALENRDAGEVMRLLDLDRFVTDLAEFQDTLRHTYNTSGVATAGQASDALAKQGIVVEFGRTNPIAVSRLNRYSLNLIQGITNETKEAVRTHVREVISRGTAPINAAREIRQFIGLTPRMQNAVSNYRRALESMSPSATSRAIGGNAERIVNAAIRDNTMSAAKVDKLVESYTDRMLRLRAQTIAQTEAQRAVSMGANEAWNQVADEIKVPKSAFKRYWVATSDDKTRESHAEIPYLNSDGVGLDEPFQLPGGGTIMYPQDPNAPPEETINCRCTVVVRIEEVQDILEDLPILAGRSILPEGSR